jgi:hypothetical protein
MTRKQTEEAEIKHVYYSARLGRIEEFDWFWHGFFSLCFGGLPDYVIYLGEL